jgi:hypothetical protein
MRDDSMLGEHLRLKIVETLIRIEHLPIMATEQGLAIFGQICTMAGQCCRYVAEGRTEQALKAAKTIGRAVPHAFPVCNDRNALEEALEELIAVLERPEVAQYH